MNATPYTIQARDLAKQFNCVYLFKNLDFTVHTGGSFCVTGPNGSGKSTLLKICAGLLTPSEGIVTLSDKDHGTIVQERTRFIGYTGPLINPYDELTALENIDFALSTRPDAGKIDALLYRFNLERHKNKKIKHYSSGMKQRLRIILADLGDPPVLLLDEPSTNLDREGKDILYSYLNSVRKKKIIILATNEKDEEKLCGGGIRFEQGNTPQSA